VDARGRQGVSGGIKRERGGCEREDLRGGHGVSRGCERERGGCERERGCEIVDMRGRQWMREGDMV